MLSVVLDCVFVLVDFDIGIDVEVEGLWEEFECCV